MKSKNLEHKHPLCQPILALMKTSEVFNCARRLPFPPGTTCKTQLPSQHAAEQWVTLSVCCCCHSHWALSVRTTQTGPWPYKPNPNYCDPRYPAKRRNRSSSCSLWSFSKSGGKNNPDKCCLRCNWACKDIKAWISWRVMKRDRLRADRKRHLT